MSILRALVAISFFLAVPLAAPGASAASEESSTCVHVITGPTDAPLGLIVKREPGVGVGVSTGDSMYVVTVNPGLHCLPASGNVVALAGQSPDEARRLLP